MANSNQILHEYARRGLHVHPLVELGKTPSMKGWQERSTTDLKVLNAWEDDDPYSNYGIQTGRVSGIWVLDIDCKNGKDGLAELNAQFPDFDLETIGTPVVRTPTGGYHVYFRYPTDGSVKNSTNILAGVDVRGDGGYVVAPPSVLEIDGDYVEYQWLNPDGTIQSIQHAPQYLLDLVQKKGRGVSRHNRNGKARLAEKRSNTFDTSGVQEGERDQYIFQLIYQAKKQEIVKDDALIKALEAAENCTPPFDEDAVYEKVNRIFDDSNYSASRGKNGKRVGADDDYIEKYNERYAVVIAGTKTVILDEKKANTSESINKSLLTFDDFNKFYANQKIDVGDKDKSKLMPTSKLWLGNPERRQYEGIVFDPSNNHKPDEYNFWRGFPIDPEKGECSTIWDYVRDVICAKNDDTYVYLRKWIAHIFQKPYELPRTSIVIMGKQGVGKSTLTKILSKLLYGMNYLEVASVDRMLGRFNGALANRLVVNANEAVWGGDKSHTGELKALITDSNMTIEMKGQDSIQYRNYGRYIFTTNSDYPVNIDGDDRRFVFLECSDERKGDSSYWDALNEQISTPEVLSALMYDLMNEDLSGWRPEERPVANIDRQLEIKYRSMTKIEKFVYEWVKDRVVESYDRSDLYPEWYSRNFKDFYEEYRQWLTKSGMNDQYTTEQTLAMTVAEKILPVKKKKKGGVTTWHFPPWSDVYGFYCENVIHCNPEWDRCERRGRTLQLLKYKGDH